MALLKEACLFGAAERRRRAFAPWCPCPPARVRGEHGHPIINLNGLVQTCRAAFSHVVSDGFTSLLMSAVASNDFSHFSFYLMGDKEPHFLIRMKDSAAVWP